MNCIHCGSDKTEKRGKSENGKQQRYCKTCTKWFSGTGAPRILLFDIETSHIEFRGWDTGEQYVAHRQITKDWYVLCWSAKFLFGDKLYSDVVTPAESLRRDDSRVCESVHKLLSQADIVITQNGDKFDIKKLQWKFMKYQLPPNNRYHSIDTLKKARQLIDPPSFALNSIAKELGFGEKSPMEEQDWIDAENGNKAALIKMSKYCNNDIHLLEDWYLYLRPWMKTHPNLEKYVDMYRELEKDETICPRCLNTLHKGLFNKKWLSLASGKQYSSGSCTHCGAQLRITYGKEV